MEKLDTVGLEEIRVRLERPLMAKIDGGIYLSLSCGLFLRGCGCLFSHKGRCGTDSADYHKNSWYAWQQEILNGYLTLPGGHRVGIGGQAVLPRAS